MPYPSARVVRNAKWVAVPVALLASGLVVATSSYSAFSATTSNPTNNWSAGIVNLTDDDANVAMFTATKLKPGDTGTKCIAVTSTGNVPALVKLYGTNPARTNALDTYLKLKVQQGSGGSFGDCTGFTLAATGSSVFDGTLAGFGTAATSYPNGLDNWATTGTASESRTYKFTYTVDTATPNSAQGGTASIGFTWESQNT